MSATRYYQVLNALVDRPGGARCRPDAGQAAATAAGQPAEGPRRAPARASTSPDLGSPTIASGYSGCDESARILRAATARHGHGAAVPRCGVPAGRVPGHGVGRRQRQQLVDVATTATATPTTSARPSADAGAAPRPTCGCSTSPKSPAPPRAPPTGCATREWNVTETGNLTLRRCDRDDGVLRRGTGREGSRRRGRQAARGAGRTADARARRATAGRDRGGHRLGFRACRSSAPLRLLAAAALIVPVAGACSPNEPVATQPGTTPPVWTGSPAPSGSAGASEAAGGARGREAHRRPQVTRRHHRRHRRHSNSAVVTPRSPCKTTATGKLAPGFHGMHIHSVGKCEANSVAPTGGAPGDFNSAGAHFQVAGHTGAPRQR